MVNKLKIFVPIALLCATSLGASPVAILKNAAGNQVYIYEIPQQTSDDMNELSKQLEALLNDLKELSNLGVEQLLVDDISPTLLAKLNDGLAALSGAQAWESSGLPITYLDPRLIERAASIIHSLGAAEAMSYAAGKADLEAIYQQCGFDADKAKKLSTKYQALFTPLCTQISQLMAKIATLTQREAEQLVSLYQKFEQCFINHLFIIFGATRKSLTNEHNALLQEIAAYKDGAALEAEYKSVANAFKKSALWLSDTGAEETLSNYVGRVNFLSAEEKQAIEELAKKNPMQAPAAEDFNLIKVSSAALPLIAIRAVHSIIAAQKNVAFFSLDPSMLDNIKDLLGKAGYTEVASQA